MTVREIIKKYLDDNRFDGLCGDMCGCEKDDLMCCDSNPADCVPGYKKLCVNCEKETKENCEWFNDNAKFCICEEKQGGKK